jgi:hypothetical protein
MHGCAVGWKLLARVIITPPRRQLRGGRQFFRRRRHMHRLSTANPNASSPVEGVCGVGPTETLPPCSEDVRDRNVCTGAISACRSPNDASEPSVFVCQNLAEGVALQWTQAILVSTPCENRQLVSCPPGATEPQSLHDELSNMLSQCLGNESWVSVAFAGGCAILFTIASSQPDRIACVRTRLESERYACAMNVSCAGALLSTLI